MANKNKRLGIKRLFLQFFIKPWINFSGGCFQNTVESVAITFQWKLFPSAHWTCLNSFTKNPLILFQLACQCSVGYHNCIYLLYWKVRSSNNKVFSKYKRKEFLNLNTVIGRHLWERTRQGIGKIVMVPFYSILYSTCFRYNFNGFSGSVLNSPSFVSSRK